MRQGTTSATRGDARTVRGILLDLDGVVYVGRTVLPGSLHAISQISGCATPPQVYHQHDAPPSSPHCQ